MRENRTSGSEGGAAQTNASFLPLSAGVVGEPDRPQRRACETALEATRLLQFR